MNVLVILQTRLQHLNCIAKILPDEPDESDETLNVWELGREGLRRGLRGKEK